MDTLFDIEPSQARQNVHACTGPGCDFCAWLDGRQAKQRATDAVRFDPRWRHDAIEWRRTMIGRTVTADDLVDAIGLPDGSPNQVGALFRSWGTMSLVKALEARPSKRNTNHARRVIVWEVLA